VVYRDRRLCRTRRLFLALILITRAGQFTDKACRIELETEALKARASTGSSLGAPRRHREIDGTTAQIRGNPLQFPAQGLSDPVVTAKVERHDNFDVEALLVTQIPVRPIRRNSVQALVIGGNRKHPATALEKITTELFPAILTNARRRSDQRICFRQPFNAQGLYG
jgi:hypothetical protein